MILPLLAFADGGELLILVAIGVMGLMLILAAGVVVTWVIIRIRARASAPRKGV